MQIDKKELLIFIILIGVIATLFTFTADGTEVTAAGELNNSDNVVYNAGDTFQLMLDAGKTTDTSLGSKGVSKSKDYPYSEDWDDYGLDNCQDRYEDGDGGCAKEAIEDGEMTKEELAEKVKDKKADPNGDNWIDCNGSGLCKGDAGWKSDMGNGKWNQGEKMDGNRQWDYGEYVHDVDNNSTYTEDLLAFRWYKIEEVRNPIRGKQLLYVGLDGHTLNTNVCSVNDFLKNKCDNADMFVNCGSRSNLSIDDEGMTEIFNAPSCEDFVFVNKKNGIRKPWKLEYEGNDVGTLEINLKVLDLGSYYVNGDNKLMVHDEQFSFDCTRLKEAGPEVGSKVTYKSLQSESVSSSW